MADLSVEAATDFAPLGSGLGTFRDVYGTYEHPWSLERTYVNHAHNDYLEVAVETGLPGVLLVIVFLLWWTRTAWNRWRSEDADAFARAATIGSAAILVHSLVDYPLRTSAIAVLFAASLALMVQRQAQQAASTRKELWPARHLEVR